MTPAAITVELLVLDRYTRPFTFKRFYPVSFVVREGDNIECSGVLQLTPNGPTDEDCIRQHFVGHVNSLRHKAREKFWYKVCEFQETLK